MELSEVTRVADALRGAGCRFWLEGGWGVDALVGRQTREHRDVDVDVHDVQEDLALDVLARLGYVVEVDWRPTRVELGSPGRGWVDLHPVRRDPEGGWHQAALDGGWHAFPPDCFTTGRIGDVELPCVSLAAQRSFHTGYELRPVDHHDLALLDGLVGDDPVS